MLSKTDGKQTKLSIHTEIGRLGSGPYTAEPANNMVERVLNRIPGHGGCELRWNRNFHELVRRHIFRWRKKAGHGAFDVEKPEAVQTKQDSVKHRLGCLGRVERVNVALCIIEFVAFE